MSLANLRRLPMAMGRCKYLRGSCSVTGCGRSGLESNFRQLPTATLRQSPLMPLFFASNGSSLAYFPNQRYRNRSFSVDGSNGGPISNEERWEIRFQELVEFKREFGNTLVPKKYPDNPQLGIWVNTQRYEYKRKQKGEADERISRLNEIGFVWDANAAAWKEMFQQLLLYKDEHGDTLVPQNYPNYPQLGTWVKTQRTEYRRKQSEQDSWLTDERISRLSKIGFVWDANEAAWKEMFQQLKEYKDKHGDTIVPRNYPNNPKLSYWVNRQRVEYKLKQRGEDFRLTDERVSRLNGIGFVWDANAAAWEEKFQQLLMYKNEHGDTLVPRNYPNNPQLGTWVTKQRHEYNLKQSGKDSQLSPEREVKLNEIGFVWDANAAAWEEKFQQLLLYKDEHGTALVPKNYSDNPQLGFWVDAQRQNRKNNKLAPERVEKLDEFDFVWDANEAAWQSNYIKLCSFYTTHGHTRIPLQGFNALYSWGMKQRCLKGEGRLQDHKYDQLKKINFDFFTREVAKGSGLIENMIIYELENMGHQFDMTNKVFFGVKNKYRPDGVIFVAKEAVIFFEVDERNHSHPKYSIKREHRRMKALSKEAEVQGFARVIFVRVSTGYRRQVNCNQSLSQLEFVSKHLHELKSNVQQKRLSIHYIDYPEDHRHVLASKETFDEVHALTSQ